MISSGRSSQSTSHCALESPGRMFDLFVSIWSLGRQHRRRHRRRQSSQRPQADTHPPQGQYARLLLSKCRSAHSMHLWLSSGRRFKPKDGSCDAGWTGRPLDDTSLPDLELNADLVCCFPPSCTENADTVLQDSQAPRPRLRRSRSRWQAPQAPGRSRSRWWSAPPPVRLPPPPPAMPLG